MTATASGAKLTHHGAEKTHQAAALQALPIVEGFELVRVLGRGGMGVVFEAVRKADGMRMAMKTISPAIVGSQVQVERFFREARILCQLKHPHIVGFHEMGEERGLLWFAMDFVDGIDAAKLLRQQGPLPVKAAVRMICQILSALQYAHGEGFVHRDIKPANLLVATSGLVKIAKLTDFGLARVYQGSQLSGLTLHGDVGGTFAYMPPEQITNFREVKPAADQYSAAATLYNLLTARHHFDFKTKGAGSYGVILNAKPIPIERHRDDLPAGLADVIQKALSRDQKKRYANIGRFRAALMPFA